MPKEFKYTYNEDGKDSISIDYDPEGEEQLDSSVQDGVPSIYLNPSGMITLAKILIKMATSSHSHGFHVHLSKNFNADEPQRLVILLSSKNRNAEVSRPRAVRSDTILPED